LTVLVYEHIRKQLFAQERTFDVPAATDDLRGENDRITRSQTDSIIGRRHTVTGGRQRPKASDVHPTGMAKDHRSRVSDTGKRHPGTTWVEFYASNDQAHTYPVSVLLRTACA
jgi:hypothetical protein